MIKSSKCLCRSYKRISLFLYSFNVKVKPFNKCTPSTSLDASWGLKRLFFLSLAFFFLVTTWHHDYPLCNSTADNSVRDLGAFWVQLLKPGAARLKEATRSSPQRSDNVTFNSTPPRCFFNFPCSLQTWPTRVTSLEAIYQVFFFPAAPSIFSLHMQPFFPRSVTNSDSHFSPPLWFFNELKERREGLKRCSGSSTGLSPCACTVWNYESTLNSNLIVNTYLRYFPIPHCKSCGSQVL